MDPLYSSHAELINFPGAKQEKQKRSRFSLELWLGGREELALPREDQYLLAVEFKSIKHLLSAMRGFPSATERWRNMMNRGPKKREMAFLISRVLKCAEHWHIA
jgi:hypothetical protein